MEPQLRRIAHLNAWEFLGILKSRIPIRKRIRSAADSNVKMFFFMLLSNSTLERVVEVDQYWRQICCKAPSRARSEFN